MGASPLFAETKSVIAEFSTDALANALIIGNARCGREPALVAPVILSASAPAALLVPAVSLATRLDVQGPGAQGLESKASNESRTTPFKNVFDSLTLFEDLQHQDGAGQNGAAVPKSSIKRDQLADSTSGTEEVVVPQTPSGTLPKPSLVLQLAAVLQASANNAVRENHGLVNQDATEEEAPARQSAPSREQGDSASSPAVKSQPASSAASLLGPPLPFNARLDVPSTPSTKAFQAVATATPAQAQTALPMEAQSSSQPVAAPQQPTTPTNQASTGPDAIAKPLAVKSVLMPMEWSSAKPLQTKPVQGEVVKTSLARQEAMLPSAGLPIRGSAPAVRSSTSAATEKPAPANRAAAASLNIETAPPASVKSSVTLSNPAPQFSPAQDRVSSAQPTLLPDRIAAPVTPQQTATPSSPPANVVSEAPVSAQAAVQPTGTEEPAVPAPTVSSVEREAEPTVTSEPVAVSTPSTAPLSGLHEDMDRVSETSSLFASGQEAPAITTASKIPLLPQAENFAFAIRMLGLESSFSNAALTNSKTSVTTNQTPVTQTKGLVTQPQAPELQQQPAQSDNPAPSGTRQAPSPAPETEKSNTVAQKQFDLLGMQQTLGVTQHWNGAPVLQVPEFGSVASAPERVDEVHPNLPLAAQETYSLAPELPGTSAGTEILLHLTGNDQSSAAIRVADRAGSVNVSVHASDPVLRESLRSNLGELSAQLNTQGWKAEVLKSSAVVMHSESPQDSHTGGQRGSQQQQSSGHDRQPQRDRRANGGQWQRELDQQITDDNAHSGENL